MRVKAKQTRTRSRASVAGEMRGCFLVFIKRNKLANCTRLDFDWLILDDLQRIFRILHVCGRKLESLCVCPRMNNSQSFRRGLPNITHCCGAKKRQPFLWWQTAPIQLDRGILSLSVSLSLENGGPLFLICIVFASAFPPLRVPPHPVTLHRGTCGLLLARLSDVAT